MNDVYVLIWELDIESHNPSGVYSSRKKAELAKKELLSQETYSDGARIVKFKVDEDPIAEFLYDEEG